MRYILFTYKLAMQFCKMLSLILCISGLMYSGSAQALSFSLNGSPDLATMLVNLSKAVPALMRLVTALAYVMGFFFIVKGVLELKHYGEGRSMMSQEHSLAKPLTFLSVGALLIYLPGSVNVGMSTFWTSPNPYGYGPQTDTGNWADLTDAAFMIIQLVGTIAFIRGLLILTQMGHGGQPGNFAKAMAHIIAGVMCINLYQFLQTIFNTLGIGTLSP